MAKRRTKLQEAIHALALISFLDMDSKSTLADAIKIAENALRAIDRDEMRVTLATNTPENKAHLYIASASGNEAHVHELTPLIIDLLDSIVEAQVNQPIDWGEPIRRAAAQAAQP